MRRAVEIALIIMYRRTKPMTLYIENDSYISGKHLHSSGSRPTDLLHLEEMGQLDRALKSSAYRNNLIAIQKSVSKEAECDVLACILNFHWTLRGE